MFNSSFTFSKLIKLHKLNSFIPLTFYFTHILKASRELETIVWVFLYRYLVPKMLNHDMNINFFSSVLNRKPSPYFPVQLAQLLLCYSLFN